MKKISIKQILWLLLGILMLGGGSGMFIKVSIGSDALSCFYEGLGYKLGVTAGTASVIMNAVYLIAVFFLDKKKIGISTFAFMILGKYPIDFFNKIFFTPNSLIIAILLDIVICVIIAVGCAVIVKANLGATAYDSLTLATAEVTKAKYVIVRYIYDGTLLLLGFLFGGKVGIATFLSFIIIGPVFNYSLKVLVKK